MWNNNKLICVPKYKIKILLFHDATSEISVKQMKTTLEWMYSYIVHLGHPCRYMDITLNLCHINSLTYLIISKVTATYSSPSSPLLRTQVLFINSGRPLRGTKECHREGWHRISLSASVLLSLRHATFCDYVRSV